MIFFKHRRSAERDAFSVPRSVQKSIPIKRIYKDGIFQVSGKFSKTWRFFDVNYAVASPEKQRELFMTYCSFLNSLPIGATAKITLFNRQLNQKNFGRTLLMPMKGDGQDQYRGEYNDLLLDKAAESNNLIQEKYITISVEKKNIEEARTFFSRVSTDLTTGLSRMASSVREITVNDRLRLLHDFYRPGEEQFFRFDLEDATRKGHDFRDSIAPDCISFQKNHYELGNHVGRTLFLREYASFISDSMITELTDYPRNMMLSIDIIPVAMDEAVSDIRKRIMSVESDITRWQQRQNQSNNFTANIPYDLEQMRSETKEFMDDLMSRDQRMMLALVTLTHLADNLEQLDQDTEALQAIGRARGCQFNILRYQQEDALNTVLPLGLKRIDATRTLTTECTAVLMPFKSQEIQDAGGIYYGVNAVSHNLIVCNRGNLLNGNGFITGVSGSGKSMAAKQEVSALALSTDHDIIIVDPEREYGELVKALGGEVITISASDPNGCHINALDLSEGYGDGKEPLVMKSEFIMSLYEQLMGKAPDYRTVLAVTTSDPDLRVQFSNDLLAAGGVKTVAYNDETIDAYRDMMSSVNMIVVVLVTAAAALAFIVLYNLTNINITERMREIATLKVLGFTPREMNAYIFREIFLLAAIGCAVGLVLGVWMEGFVVVTAEVDQIMFGRAIHPTSFLLAFLLTMLFTVLVMLAMRGKLRRIDMVESLKSNE